LRSPARLARVGLRCVGLAVLVLRSIEISTAELVVPRQRRIPGVRIGSTSATLPSEFRQRAFCNAPRQWRRRRLRRRSGLF
jgi:hypothetical protein